MKRQITRILSVLVVASGSIQAQQKAIQPCMTFNAMEEVFTQDPDARIRYEKAVAEFEQNMHSYTGKSAAPEFTVPVVFHVLHTGGSDNLADAAIQQALAWVNMDFDRTHTDVNTIQQPFQNLFIDSDIKFMLAHKDPQGNCTSGIVHHYDQRTVWDRTNQLGFNSPLYAGITWDPTKYLNVIVVREIVSQSSGGGQVVGYTFKPGTHGPGDTRDAVVIMGSFLNNFQNARYLTHEIGHWLGLSHTFGNTNDPGIACGDDNICDTPPTKGKLGGCPASSGSNFACAPTATCGYNAGDWNVENIMDYSDCSKNFTAGQTQVMRNVLTSGPSQRPNLSTLINLSLTDVDGVGLCAPRADFASAADSYTVCAGSNLTMKEYSYNGSVSQFNWSADNGAIVASPSSSVTSINFPNTGTVNVSLTVSNQYGSHVKTKAVTVVPGLATMQGPLFESFEMGVLPNDWMIENPSGGINSTWIHTWNAAYDGSGSFFIEGQNQPASQTDYLNTPIINMQMSPVKDLTFAYAYARKNSSTSDVFTVQATADCGGTWVNLVTLSAGQMQQGSGGTTAAFFIPSTSQWKTVSLANYPTSMGAWATLSNSPHLRVRFAFMEGASGLGNNFYLDAIELPATVGMSEVKAALQMGVYPNPATDVAALRFRLSDPAEVNVNVTDLSGRVLISRSAEMEAGEQELMLNENADLASGVYLVDLEVDGIKVTEKLIIR